MDSAAFMDRARSTDESTWPSLVEQELFEYRKWTDGVTWDMVTTMRSQMAGDLDLIRAEREPVPEQEPEAEAEAEAESPAGENHPDE